VILPGLFSALAFDVVESYSPGRTRGIWPDLMVEFSRSMDGDMNMPRDILLIATADWDTKPWTNKQHMAKSLAGHGFRVVYVESLGLRRPTSDRRDFARIVRRVGRAVRGLRRVDANIWLLSPLVLPLHGNASVRLVNTLILSTVIKKSLRSLDFSRFICWTYNPLTTSLLDHLDPECTVYHCVDDLSAVPGIDRELLAHADASLVKRADVVFVTNPIVRDRWLELKGKDVHYLPNVADYEHFSRGRKGSPIPAEIVSIPPPRVGYVGTISDYKIDFDMVIQIAQQRPDWHWVFIGEAREGQRAAVIQELGRLSNVHFLGYRDYQGLPEYLSGFDIATLPMLINQYTVSMFPMKFFEYLAAGRPVIATKLPALEEYREACRFVSSAQEFIEVAERILKGDAPDSLSCDRVARKHTWEWRTQEMLSIMAASSSAR
jgi:glycosyltransferase involved in cell wall biosynthesis